MAGPLAFDNPEAYIAGDRRRALAAGVALPDRVHGAALFADISGFTPLTEALVEAFGAQRGAEQLSSVLDAVFDALLGHLHRYGGSVVFFSGDAVTCWLDGDDGRLAAGCALAMQQAMAEVGRVALPSGAVVPLAMKVAVAVGPARRFVVGDPAVQLIDVLAGALMDRLAATEQQAAPGQVLLDPETADALGPAVTGHRAGRAAPLVVTGARPVDLPPEVPHGEPLPEEVVRPWLLPAVYERLRTGRGEFLAELRTAVPLFLRFGGIDHDHDPDAAQVLDAFVVAAQRVVDGYGGSTLQLTLGDKGAYLYAVFGTPHAHEDDAARACAAAVELLELSAAHPVTGLRIGVSQGRVRSGTYGHRLRRTFCCLGDPVNLAARLMSAAGDGEAWVSEPVQRAAAAGFRWSSLPPLRVKGKAEPVRAYALRGTDRGRVASRHRRHSLPLVGRTEALAVLERHVVSLVDGKGGVVALTGGTGLGKSRLMVEAVRLLGERGVAVAEGEAQPFGNRTSYWVWHDVWRRLLGLGEGSPEQQAGALPQRVGALDPSLLPRLPLLGSALGLPLAENELTAALAPQLRKASLEALLTSLLVALTADGTAQALLLEDCQWLDPLSADLLAVLARASRDLPVLVVVASRTGDESGAVAALRAHEGFEELVLAELDAAESLALVTAKLAELDALDGPVPAPLARLVTGRAEGNPFYLEELVSYVVAAGVDRDDGAALDRLDLPDSLQSLALSRIDTLAEGPRRTAKVASVIGRQFPTAMLTGVYPELGDDDEVSGHLAALRDSTLVVAESTAASATGETHLFRHVVTAQAAYESIPVAMRETLHDASGSYLEARSAPATAADLDILAYHFAHSANRPKQREYLGRAGDRARTDYANETAIGHYRRLADLVDAAERPEVLLRLGGVLQLTGRWAEAEAAFEEARSRSAGAGDEGGVARARTALAEVARRGGRYDEAGALLAQAEEGFVALGDRSGRGEVLHLRGTLAAQQGDYPAARAAYEASLVLRRELGEDDRTAALYSNLGVIAEYTGDLPGAQALNEQALELRLGLGDRWAIGVSQNNLGMIALLRGDHAGAAARFTEAMRLQREVGDLWMVAIADNNLGNARRELGELEEAGRHLGAALAGYGRFADRWALAIVFEDIAVLAARLDRAGEALRLLGAAGALRDILGSPRSPAQEEALDAALAPAREAVGDQAGALVAAGAALDPEDAAALAAGVCR